MGVNSCGHHLRTLAWRMETQGQHQLELEDGSSISYLAAGHLLDWCDGLEFLCSKISVWKGWQWKHALGTLAAKSYQLSWALFEPGFLSASSSGASSSGTSTPSSASSSFGIKLRDINECMFLTIKMRPSRRARREGSGNNHRRCFTRCAKLAWLHWHCLTSCRQKWNDAMMMMSR